MSLGTNALQSLDDAVRGSIAAGITYVVSAGNDGGDACAQSPERVPEAITVAASDEADARAYDSNTGTCVDLFAPGVNVLSASFSDNDGSAIKSGTSMASPHVAGAAALYLQANPAASPAAVANALLVAATPSKISNAGTGTPNRLLYTGSFMASNDSVAPSVSITSPAAGAALSGTVTVLVSASDDVAVARVEAYASGKYVGVATTPPFSIGWNTESTPNGAHTLLVKVYDTSANLGSSGTVSVTVANATAALYDSGLRAPACRSSMHLCDTFGRTVGLLGPARR